MTSLSRRTCLPLLLAAFAARAEEPVKPLRVLFVGNSYTSVNNLPGMIAALARAGKQRPLEATAHTPGGCTFEKHWTDGKATAKIAQGGWDFVVLQEQSQMPFIDPARMADFAKKLHGEIAKTGARTLLYQTWARRNMPEKQDAISKAYTDLATVLPARLAPVGEAWRKARADLPDLALHSPDGSHPTPAGTYLAACVFYATLYGQSPEGLTGEPAKLDETTARALQRIAWTAVQ